MGAARNSTSDLLGTPILAIVPPTVEQTKKVSAPFVSCAVQLPSPPALPAVELAFFASNISVRLSFPASVFPVELLLKAHR